MPVTTVSPRNTPVNKIGKIFCLYKTYILGATIRIKRHKVCLMVNGEEEKIGRGVWGELHLFRGYLGRVTDKVTFRQQKGSQ